MRSGSASISLAKAEMPSEFFGAKNSTESRRRWSFLEIARMPLVSTLIALQNLGGRLPTLSGLEVSPLSLPGGGAKFDLTLELAEDDRGLLGTLEYRSDFFEHSTVERLAGQFLRLLEGAAA